jgi:hypothetical protein
MSFIYNQRLYKSNLVKSMPLHNDFLTYITLIRQFFLQQTHIRNAEHELLL